MTVTVLIVLLSAGTAGAESPSTSEAASFFSTVLPFVKMYCADCHAGEEPEGEIVLERFQEPANRLEDREVWEKVLRAVANGEMPPDGSVRPAPDELTAIQTTISAELARFNCEGKIYPGRVTIRRLNRVEYNNTIRDLTGIDFQPAADFPSDDVGAGFDNIADVLTIPPILVEKYLAAAAEILQRAFADPAARERIYVCDPAEVDEEEIERCYIEIVENFARRAYRRPLSDDESSRLLGLGRRAVEQGAGPEQALQVTLQATLASPHFLFRIELDPDPDDPDSVRDLSDYELASRLSYFLWSSMPDDHLFELADQGKLREPAVMREEVKRMLADEKSAALVQNFAGQWLQLRDLDHLNPSTELYPTFSEELRSAMRRETELFFEHVMHEDQSLMEFLTANYSFVNETLARHYGLPGVEGHEFQKVSLNDQRTGVLTHGSILLLTSNPTRTSPVKRGKWILENFLDDPPPPPAPGIAQLEEQPELLGSLRERMEQHRSDPTCAVCHLRMDALGFGLENFDAVGAWREQDGRYPVDAAGSLPGGLKFSSPRELMHVLSEHKKSDFCRCLAKKMLTYGLGRELRTYDRCVVDEIVNKLMNEDDRFSSLVLAIVTSSPFTQRGSRGPGL
jgi:hypothetical protein